MCDGPRRPGTWRCQPDTPHRARSPRVRRPSGWTRRSDREMAVRPDCVRCGPAVEVERHGPRVRARGRQMVSGSRGTARVSAFSRRECVRVVQVTSAFPEKGRGECRALDAPAVSRAKWGREHTRSSPWVHRGHPAFPHTMVLTVSFVISPVIGLCCHRRLARLSAKLDASVEASEPHDFAVRVQHRSSAVLTLASIASRPASVTIASAPRWDETAQ